MFDLNTETVVIAQLAAGVLVVALVGYVLGARRARRERRRMQRTLGQREIELLEARAETARLAETVAQGPRRERLLTLTLGRLSDALECERGLFVETSRLRLESAEASSRLRQATRLARSSSARVRELEAAGATTGTITTRAPKSYGNGKAVTVSVVDHERPEARREGVARVTHSERARFARLQPSNEVRPADGELSAIDGLAVADEHRLNSLGIHRLEQLARMSEHEQRRLVAMMGKRGTGQPLASWIGNARELLERRTSS